MNKITLALKSRTFWTIALMWFVSHGPIIAQLLPENTSAAFTALLGFLAVVFHVNPSQNYSS